jgi:antirestriction protein ArdC
MSSTTKLAPAYEAILTQITTMLANGTVPWRKGWNESMPYNGVSKKAYRGINLWVLYGMPDPRWYTFNQVNELKAKIRKGEKPRYIVFWTMFDSKTEKDAKGNPKKVPFLRYSKVWNASQIEGLPNLDTSEFEVQQSAEDIVKGYIDCPEIQHGFSYAAYNYKADLVKMPNRGDFKTEAEYYATLFHELGHSTGHKSRLNRDTLEESAAFGSEVYSKEELIAELAAAFLCAKAGVNNELENSAAYIQGWLRALANDPKMIVTAASAAQKAVDYITMEPSNEAEPTSDLGVGEPELVTA